MFDNWPSWRKKKSVFAGFSGINPFTMADVKLPVSCQPAHKIPENLTIGSQELLRMTPAQHCL